MTKHLTVASLALNVVVLTALIWVLQRQTPQVAAPMPVVAHDQAGASISGSALLRLHGELRKAGLDEASTQRVLAQVLRSAEARGASAEYWKSDLAASRTRTLAQYDELRRARTAIRSAIGARALDEADFALLFRPYGTELDFLSPEKQMALQEIEMQDLSGSDTQLKALLSGSDWQEYRYRRSPLRQRLLATGFDFTRDEYRAVFDAISAVHGEQEVAFTAGLVGDPVRDPQLAAHLRRALGTERFATFQKVQDPLYMTLVHVGRAHNLSDRTIDAAYTLVSESDQGMVRTASHAPLNSAQQDAELRKLLGGPAFDLFSSLAPPRTNSNQVVVFTSGH